MSKMRPISTVTSICSRPRARIDRSRPDLALVGGVVAHRVMRGVHVEEPRHRGAVAVASA
jgi:hypothetical protein